MLRFSMRTVNPSVAIRWMVAWLSLLVSLFSVHQAWGATPMVSAGYAHNCAVLSSGAVQCWGNNSTSPVAVTGMNNAISVSAGSAHSCAVLSSGLVQCWGSNDDGQLGNGTTNYSAIPVTVSGISNATAVSAGANHSCAVLSSGVVVCWGSHEYGKLGTGSSTINGTRPGVVARIGFFRPPFSTIPLAVVGINNASAVSAGNSHSCAVLNNGAVQCWGSNTYGELGSGPTTNSTSPVTVSGISNATSVSAGGNSSYEGGSHSCALLGGGAVQCWGSNGVGQLGAGFTSISSTPVVVAGITNATAVSVHSLHACALLSSGAVQCWGSTGNGQLGNVTPTNSTSPVTVVGVDNATSVSAGANHSCAALSSGAVLCWGYNGAVQLGNGVTLNRFINTSAVPVSGLNGANAVSVGYSHSCALLSGGAAHCWGSNYYGQLGSPPTTNTTSPTAVSGISSAVSVSANGYQSCATLSNGTVQCWGINDLYPGGKGDLTRSTIPVTVAGISNATSVSTGYSHSCARLSSGAVQCWGATNYTGLLGNGATLGSNNPVTVSGISTATSISVGGGHTCAVLSIGTVQCWGYNDYGQLGDGTKTAINSPVTVVGINTAIAVTAGESHSCALLSSGQVQCWGYDGYNYSGQLGHGLTTGSSVPVFASGITNATAISGGRFHTCAVLASGEVQCFGHNGAGQLGNGSFTSSTSPVTVPGISNAIAVSAGYFHTCAVLSSGGAHCWGSDEFGEGGTGRTFYYAPGAVVGANGQGVLNLIDVVASTVASDTDKVFDWAERNFPQFSPTGAASRSILGYRYRVYADRYYLAVNQAGTPHLYYFDDQSMTTLLDVGLLSDFLALVAR